MSEDERWQRTLRVNLKQAQDENRQLRSILPLITTTSKKDMAAHLALDIQKNGFRHRSFDEVRGLLGGGPKSSTLSDYSSQIDGGTPNGTMQYDPYARDTHFAEQVRFLNRGSMGSM